jgi:hypothetical protein
MHQLAEAGPLGVGRLIVLDMGAKFDIAESIRKVRAEVAAAPIL